MSLSCAAERTLYHKANKVRLIELSLSAQTVNTKDFPKRGIYARTLPFLFSAAKRLTECRTQPGTVLPLMAKYNT